MKNKVTVLDNYKKYKEQILYLFFGGLTTLISIGVFAFFTKVIPLDELIANIISWVIAVLFAFVTNRLWVFESAKDKGIIKQILSFYAARLATLGVEEVLLLVFIKLLSLNSIAVKTTAQIVVIILNYIISKIFIFKK
ncbi:MAG: GtrA family protein [Clostridia bacterium]|nr:GtrA family protein [Clostridia bacterium]